MSRAEPPAGHPPRGWSDALGRTPLRVRLVAALVALVAIGLIVTSVTSASLLRGYLLHRVDDQLLSNAQRLVSQATEGFTGDNRQRLPSSYYLQVSDPRGTVTGSTKVSADLSPPRIPPLNAGQVASRANQPFTVGSTTGSGRWRAVAEPVPGTASTLIVAVSMSDVDSTVARLTVVDVIVGITVLVLLALAGYLLVRSSLRPLREVETTAAAISAGDLSQRVPPRDPRTEIGRVGAAFNSMVGQIESAFAGRAAAAATARASEARMRRFVADASHELRTPLTSIRGFAELHRQGAVSERAEVDRLMRRIESEAARMGLLVEDLLLLARLDQQRPLERAPIDLLGLAVDAVHDARAVAPARAIDLTFPDRPHPPIVLGDEARLRQVLGNLMSNALHHTPDGTPVELTLDVPDGACVLLTVADHGPGLDAAEGEQIFERFYRSDSARDRSTGGTGLGLSIVAALVAAHGGTVEVSSEVGSGATFTVVLPLHTG